MWNDSVDLRYSNAECHLNLTETVVNKCPCLASQGCLIEVRFAV